jgi:general secretion pathway protein I
VRVCEESRRFGAGQLACGARVIALPNTLLDKAVGPASRPVETGQEACPTSSARGFTLLEMMVATLIMGIAVAGLMSGIAGATRNAARLTAYDRAVQLARSRMNALLLDESLPRDVVVSGPFDPNQAGGLDAGWRARLTAFEIPDNPAPGDLALDRIELEVWWMSGQLRRTFTLDAYRERTLKATDLAPAAGQ